ncbi:MAG: T9SS C-terminal target domain-containing protein [Cytophagales bacterium]|nr:MAG: T9SS C-terminal target domain-containing protein [Cytophagales bacterium]
MSKPLIYLICCLLLPIEQAIAQNTVLATGKWLKIGIYAENIYKITAKDLQKQGWDTRQINPKTLRMYGLGGAMLPQPNNINRPNDLQEQSLWIEGEADGKFDEEDFILFYGQATTQWQYNTLQQRFEHQTNYYSDTTYYFLTIDEQGQNGKRVITFNTPILQNTDATVQSWALYENNKINLLESGREWLGEAFSTATEQSFDLTLPNNPAANSTLFLTVSVAGGAASTTSFAVKVNGQTLGNINLPALPQGRYDIKANLITQQLALPASLLNGNTIRVSLSYTGSSQTAYLNFLRLHYAPQLQWNNKTSFFAVVPQGNLNQRIVWNASDSKVQLWNISQPYNISREQANAFGVVPQESLYFVLFRPEDAIAPASWASLPNQNLRAANPTELIIITAPQFRTEAERLASFRQQEGVTAKVYTTIEIYNEFSSGKKDITALRDFIRLLYLKNTQTLKYVLLFGDCSYDYLYRLRPNNDFVPIYQSIDSFQPLYSYSSDDFLGFLEDNEGAWGENPAVNHTLEVGIGRLPVNSLSEARQVVDKLINYQNIAAAAGSWRNRLSFVADDGDFNTHQRDADLLAQASNLINRQLNLQKIYLDAFPQIAAPEGENSPIAKQNITEAVQKGALILNYSGHGGEIGWAEENLLDLEQIDDWTNRFAMPLFITATCEFGRYDNPSFVSGGEKVLLNKRGGGIGLVTTTRPVFAFTNFLLNQAFYNTVFQPLSNGDMPRLGDIIRQTKNNSTNNVFNRNFALLADPSMRLAYPKHKIQLTKISQDTLRALTTATIEAEIRDKNNTLLTNFEGWAEVVVFEKERTLNTLGNQNPVMSYQTRDNVIFRGLAKVIQGKMSLQFVIPKDINYSFGNGKISFYAYSATQKTDAGGVYESFAIGGSLRTPPTDNQNPTLQIGFRDEKFQANETIEQYSLFWAKLNDENGINLSKTDINHEIKLTLTHQTSQEKYIFLLNDYYYADTNSYQKGNIRFYLPILPSGFYEAQLSAWDNHNNEAQTKTSFFLNSADFKIINAYNYPNPAHENTQFKLIHNRPDELVEVTITIHNLQGQIVRTLQNTAIIDTFGNENLLLWDLKDDRGNKIINGLYLYKIVLRSLKDQSFTQYTGKCIVGY